ncbi:cell surface protein precursor [Lactiplantibacillus plantarum]|nr:cell surface protein precursor [Lactiplantibacillus plantarum]
MTPAKIESVGLMDIEANDQYTGYWINVANPQQRLTSAELMNLYSGKNMPIGTYIWEANQAVIDANDITLEVGDDWNWTDSIESLTDQFGQKVDVQALYEANPQAVKLSGDRVNTSQPGTYRVTFKYAGKTVTALVIVKADQTSLTVHDTELHAGGTWHAQDGFDGAMDQDGHAIDFNDVTVTGEVNTMVPGDYQITYTYGSQTQTITVTVKENQASLNLYQNHATVHTDGQGTSTWQPQSNFQNATDSDGQTLDWSAIEVVGTPDWTTAGDYLLTYQFTDKTGQLVTATMTVTLVIEEADEQAESQSDLQIHDSTITVGESWQPSDNLVLATDVNGGELSLADLVVTGTVDTNQAGVYQVTYQYTDASGQIFTRVATVTVVAASDGDTNTEQPGATNTNDDVNGGSTGSIDGDDQAEIPTNDADQMEGDAADVDANAVIDDATPAVGTNHGKGADRNSGMQTTANGAKSVVTSWPHRSQMTNTASLQHAQTTVGGHHQESRPTESASVAVQPVTAKLGTSALPQTGEAPSRANVMGTVLLGLTMFGSWLGFRRVKRH